MLPVVFKFTFYFVLGSRNEGRQKADLSKSTIM